MIHITEYCTFFIWCHQYFYNIVQCSKKSKHIYVLKHLPFLYAKTVNCFSPALKNV